jgi:hypothetical protein
MAGTPPREQPQPWPGNDRKLYDGRKDFRVSHALGRPLERAVPAEHKPPPIPAEFRPSPPANKSVMFANKARAAIRCSTPLCPPISCLPRSIPPCGPRNTQHETPRSAPPLLARERVFHPLARPHPRQRLLPSCQFVKSVSCNLQSAIGNSLPPVWPPPGSTPPGPGHHVDTPRLY